MYFNCVENKESIEYSTMSIQIKFLFGDSHYHVDDHKDTDIDRTSNKGQLVNYFGKIFKIFWGLIGFQITILYF